MRNEGYYWVKLDGEWIIAECKGDDEWGYPFPSNYIADDSDFEEIDENQITRKETNSFEKYLKKANDELEKDKEEYLIKEGFLPSCSSPQQCNYTGECQQSFIGGKCRNHPPGHKY